MRGPHDPAVAGERALDEPRRAAAGQHRASRPVASPSRSRHSASRGLDRQRRRLEVVGAVAGRPAQLVPRPVDRRRRAAERRREQREGRGPRTAAARRTSPMPRTRARPPTQAERHVGAERRRHVEVVDSRPTAGRRRRRPTRRRARRRPGCACAARTCAPSAARRAAPARTRLSSPAGDRQAVAGPTTSRPSPSANVELVGEVERHHLGVDAGGSRRPRTPVTRSDSVSLAGASAGQHVGATARRPAGPSPRRRAPRPGPSGATPAASNAVGGDQPGQRPAQHLAALAEPGPHQREQPRPGRRRRPASGRRSMRDEHRLDPGLRAGTRRAGTRPTSRGRRPVRHLHRRDAVGRVARRRRPAARPPRAAPSRASGAMAGTPSSRSSTSGVATLYGRLATSAHARRRPSSAAQSSAHGVALDHRTRRPARPTSRSTGSRWRSTSTAVTAAPGLGQGQGERARGRRRSRPRGRPGPTAGQPGDAPHRVGVDDEVLPERPARRQPVLGEERRAAAGGCGSPAPGYQVMRTAMTPAPSGASGLEARRRQVDDVAVAEGPAVVDRAGDLPARWPRW